MGDRAGVGAHPARVGRPIHGQHEPQAVRSLAKRLVGYWFAPASLVNLAVVRLVLVSLELVLLLVPFIAREVGACNGCSVGYQMILTRIDPSDYFPLPALKVLMLPFGPW